MNQDQIRLSVIGREWVATFEGPQAAGIVDLFGTNTLPTPFLAACAPEWVLRSIEAANPGVRVYFAAATK